MGALADYALRRIRKQGGRYERGAGKGEAAPDAVYYLHGDEYVLKDEAVQALVDRVLDAGARDFNFDQRSAGELDAEAFHSLVNTPPLLAAVRVRSEEHTSELQSQSNLVCRLLLEKKKKNKYTQSTCIYLTVFMTMYGNTSCTIYLYTSLCFNLLQHILLSHR